MKSLLLLFMGITAFSSFSQTYNMPAGTNTVNTCSGTFYDSGGSGGNYGYGQDRTYTFCPSVAGNKIQLTFTSFNTENNYDFLYVYDGPNTGSPSLGTYTGGIGPGIVQATPSNASGCITFRFTSDGNFIFPSTAAGWSANIACIAPCQSITANLVSTNEAAGPGGIIRVCQGQSVNYVGSGTFGTSGAGATYTWNMGNGVTVNGQNINYTYPAVGSYMVNLTITDPSGCTNSNAIAQNVQVSTTPTISTSATPSTLCTTQTSALSANVTMNPYNVNCTPPVSGTTFLPDGSGVSYTTSITTNCYAPGSVITSANDFLNVCLNIEHSYLGDLDIEFICPNNQSITLKAYPGGGGTYLGGALDDGGTGPGVGATYCFTPSAGTLLVSGSTVTAGSPAGASITPGNYMPVDPFSGLIGCPLNGNWTIRVTDNLAIDNGYIFNWDFNLAAALQAVPSFTPTIVSQGWVADPILTSTGATTADVVPLSQGTPCFTYSVTDNFGCTYTAPQCITVNCGSSLPIELISFDATALTNERVYLKWITASETNSDYFVIDRSIDGEEWNEIYQTDAAGTSFNEVTYQAFDEEPLFGTSYYRLRQFDTNGDVTISDIEAVYLEGTGEMTLTVFPNPGTGLITLKGDLVSLSTFGFFDAMGKNVKEFCPIYDQGDGAVVLDVSGLAKGLYTFRSGTKIFSFTKG